jgi:hypothetical protein
VTEIAQTRQRIEADLRELETRLPSPLRSVKSVLGVLVGATALAALLRRLARSKGSDTPTTEVVIRVVHDDS